MDSAKTSKLYDLQTSRDFYEERYDHGYMDQWPLEKKQRIFDVIRSLDLPAEGDALDFGCGNGVLTEIVRQALPPAWRVYGTDLSSKAVGNAQRRYPSCTFFSGETTASVPERYDFLFTHHVLEHVYDIDETIDLMEGFLKDHAAMLHILPCGNEGSFEHGVCISRTDGINAELQNRFFYDEEGHVRRLTSNQLKSFFMPRGFELSKDFYCYQQAGAIDWITRSDRSFIEMFADPTKARDQQAKRRLSQLRWKLLLVHLLRRPAVAVDNKLRQDRRTLRDCVLIAAGLVLYPFSHLVNRSIKRRADAEWERDRMNPGGSEMFHFYKRKRKA